jgi:hypothetical protein
VGATRLSQLPHHELRRLIKEYEQRRQATMEMVVEEQAEREVERRNPSPSHHLAVLKRHDVGVMPCDEEEEYSMKLLF